MSLVELPREQHDSIPGGQISQGGVASEESLYRASPSGSNPSRQDLGPTVSDLDNESNPDEHHQDEDNLLAVTETKTMNTQTLAPALPAKSSLRVSRLLATLPQKLSDEHRPMLPHAAPHEVYLSSEEDASSSADDFSDFELESDSESDGQSSPRRESHEDIARIISVVFSGKPSLVHLPPRAGSPSSIDSRRQVAGLLRTSTEPTLSRPRSTSSASLFNLPPRSSSMITTVASEKRRPSFLSIDPFAHKEVDDESTRAPKITTTMLKKTFSLVKKRSKSTFSQPSSQPRESISSQPPPMAQLGEAEDEAAAEKSPASYQEIMELAKKNAQTGNLLSPVDAAPPTSPGSTKNKFRTGLSMGRRRSVKP